ncbi:hypothetical protein [Coleofasciculus sp. E1-EBD-02]|uniref:hypothetical protein n=1 Tax=Coleofasciculus sp. E1-EBD-02 TaxID=3068481 RepID=UPI0032F69898
MPKNHPQKTQLSLITHQSQPLVIFWLSLSLIIATSYSLLALQKAFNSPYIVQDDARQHVFWMQRYIDSQLFPNDIIADYFQSVVPVGYKTIYQLIANLGIAPLTLSKLLPLLLTLITTIYAFALTLQLLPLPIAGFISSLLVNQTLWMRDDLVSATPRAFVYPLLLGFWYYLIRRSLIPSLGAIALQGWFYPQSVLISSGVLILQLGKWQRGQLQLSRERKDYYFSAAGLIVAFCVMLPYAITTSEFEPIITASQAQQMPEFWAGGRASFFTDNFWDFWLNGDRSGLLPRRQSLPILLYAALFLPFLGKISKHFPLTRQVKPSIILLPQILLISLTLFFTAHVLLFHLHLPSRYTEHTLRLLLPIATGIALTILCHGLFQKTKILAIGFATILAGIILFYPLLVPNFPKTAYEIGTAPKLYQFLTHQPKDSLIASLSPETDNLPSFTHRSILVSWEYAIPYHLSYYLPLRQRAINLIRAQYSPDANEIKTFIQHYNIDLWLIDQSAFTPDYISHNKWIQQFPDIATEASQRLKQRTPLALPPIIRQCSIFQTPKLTILDAKCLEHNL